MSSAAPRPEAPNADANKHRHAPGGSIMRPACVACGGGALSELLRIDAFPVFQGPVDFPQGDGERAAMTWLHCAACGSAQISPLPPLEQIYQSGHATGLGAAWARHHAAFGSFVKQHSRGGIVDVGGGSGTLALAYRGAGGTAPWTILEPNALRVPGLPEDIAVIDGFLERDALASTRAHTVVMCHMFEHAVDLRAALHAISEALPREGCIVIAWPELEYWTRQGVAGALNFEHGVYLTVPHLMALFAEFGWAPAAETRWAENNTLFAAFTRGTSSMSADKGDAATAVPDYFGALRQQALRFQQALDGHDGEAFLMPASIYAQALLAMGLQEERFVALLDNSAAKQGRRLYGTRLTVEPASALRYARNPIVILNGGAHDAEIAAGLRALRPDVRIVMKD
jgi:hypothetical protein